MPELNTLEETIDNVLLELEKNGYGKNTIESINSTFRDLLKLADKHNYNFLNNHLISLFLEHDLNKGVYSRTGYLQRSRCIRYLESFLKDGTISIKKTGKSIKPDIAPEFMDVLESYDIAEEKRGLSQSSLTKNRRPVMYLLEFMTSLGYKQLSDIKHGDTTKAIEAMLTDHYDPSSFVTAISGLRRFYEMNEDIRMYRLEIPSRIQRKKEIIEVYTDEENDKILEVLNSDILSHRDAAIGMLSFETGIRGIDICKLKLGDIDWKNGSINIVQSKTGRALSLPLRSTYGNEIVKYLLNERPKVKRDFLFLTNKAPYQRLNNVAAVIRKIVTLSGIDIGKRHTGPRMFRHNAASKMVRNKIPLPVISEELGHKSKNSTMVYITTDKETMATLTLPVPFGDPAQ